MSRSASDERRNTKKWVTWFEDVECVEEDYIEKPVRILKQLEKGKRKTEIEL